MASNTISVYVPSPLFDQIKQAEAEGKLKIKEVCTTALAGAVNLAQNGQGPSPAAPDLSDTQEAQQFSDDAGQIEYTLQYQKTTTAAQSMIDNVRDEGGWVVSLSKDNTGDGFWILFGHPRVLNED